MIQDKAGNVVVISGNNSRKTEYILKSIEAGFNVLADKPMAITPTDFILLRRAFEHASKNKILLYDIMTERYEITNVIQRKLAQMPDIFGTIVKSTPEQPAVVMESVHQFHKEVNGKPLTRPAWFFDANQHGGGVVDVGTHLVDLTQWMCFPCQNLDWRRDIKLIYATSWPKKLTINQFKLLTGLCAYPAFLKKEIDADNLLNVQLNGELVYSIRGVHIKIKVFWNFEDNSRAEDTHYSLLRGTLANLIIKQGPEQRWKSILYIENNSSLSETEFERRLRSSILKLCETWPDLDVVSNETSWEIVIPEKFCVDHENHFAKVMEKYLLFYSEGRMPDWEVSHMIAKYFTTTETKNDALPVFQV
jgi:predicted dehydrogenase